MATRNQEGMLRAVKAALIKSSGSLLATNPQEVRLNETDLIFDVRW